MESHFLSRVVRFIYEALIIKILKLALLFCMHVGLTIQMCYSFILSFNSCRAKYLASNVGLNKLATSFKNAVLIMSNFECFKSYTGRYMAKTSKAQNENAT